MASQIPIQANRRSAQLSTGSRTEPGKAISGIKAPKTGIDARNEAASGEGPADLAALAAVYHHEFQPIGVSGHVLVDLLIEDNWCLRRCRFLVDRVSECSGRWPRSDVDSPVTDSPEMENPEIGFVPHTTPNTGLAAPAITHSPQMPSPDLASFRTPPTVPSAPSPSAPPRSALRFERPLMESPSDRQIACLPRT